MKKFFIRVALLPLALVSCVEHETISVPQGYVCSPYTESHPADTGNQLELRLGESYVNEVTVSVTVCEPNSTVNCVTIPHVLLDTGSNGLRIFSCTVDALTLPAQTVSGVDVGECVHYLDGTSHWGAVKLADVKLADDLAQDVPIQVIDPRYGIIPNTAPAACNNSEYNPRYSGYNGILGVGLFTRDCGTDCLSGSNNVYFKCPAGVACSSTAIALVKQVTNPVALMTSDNNGVILTIPSVADAGVVSLTGVLTLGINTAGGNNTPGGSVVAYNADVSTGEPVFETQTSSHTFSQSFIDSGSNGLYFDAFSALTGCSYPYSGFFCPASVQGLTAVHVGASGSPTSASFPYRIGNAASILSASNPNMVFSNLGGQLTGEFDWGLPFFMGKTVYIGINGAATGTALGTGPFWAY